MPLRDHKIIIKQYFEVDFLSTRILLQFLHRLLYANIRALSNEQVLFEKFRMQTAVEFLSPLSRLVNHSFRNTNYSGELSRKLHHLANMYNHTLGIEHVLSQVVAMGRSLLPLFVCIAVGSLPRAVQANCEGKSWCGCTEKYLDVWGYYQPSHFHSELLSHKLLYCFTLWMKFMQFFHCLESRRTLPYSWGSTFLGFFQTQNVDFL